MIVLLDNKYILFCSIIEKGEEHCGHLIEAHKECMRALGFKIWNGEHGPFWLTWFITSNFSTALQT